MQSGPDVSIELVFCKEKIGGKSKEIEDRRTW